MSFLQTEIRQQSQVLTTLLDRETENVQRMAAELRAQSVKYVIINKYSPLALSMSQEHDTVPTVGS